MRFALAFVAFLAVSWTFGAEALQTGARKSVKKIVSDYENPQNYVTPWSGAKMIVIEGREKSVQELIQIYESYSETLEGSPNRELFPKMEEVVLSLENGKQQEVADRICEAEINSGLFKYTTTATAEYTETEKSKPKKEPFWWRMICKVKNMFGF